MGFVCSYLAKDAPSLVLSTSLTVSITVSSSASVMFFLSCFSIGAVRLYSSIPLLVCCMSCFIQSIFSSSSFGVVMRRSLSFMMKSFLSHRRLLLLHSRSNMSCHAWSGARLRGRSIR